MASLSKKWLCAMCIHCKYADFLFDNYFTQFSKLEVLGCNVKKAMCLLLIWTSHGCQFQENTNMTGSRQIGPLADLVAN